MALFHIRPYVYYDPGNMQSHTNISSLPSYRRCFKMLASHLIPFGLPVIPRRHQRPYNRGLSRTHCCNRVLSRTHCYNRVLSQHIVT